MKQILNTSLSNLNALACAVRGPVAIGRLLLIVATFLLLTAPLTQHIWTWDHFLHGGQDFESGILVVVTIQCLAVLLSQVCKRHVDSLFAATRLLASRFNDRKLAGITGAFFVFLAVQVTGTAIGVCNLPLKI